MKRVSLLILLLVFCASTKKDVGSIAMSISDAQECKKIFEEVYHYKNVRIVDVDYNGSHYFMVKYDK